MSKKLFSILALIAALAIGVAACGDDDEETTAGDQEPIAAIDSLSGVDTAVALDGGFVDALGSLGVTPGVVGDAKLKNGSVIFPITGGNVEYYDPSQPLRPYVQGEVLHDGSGLSLEAGGTLVELENFRIDPGTSELFGKVSVDGEVAVEEAKLFDLDGSTLEPLQEGKNGAAVLTGTTVLLSDDAAGLLNDTFGIEDLAGGLVIGISTITVS